MRWCEVTRETETGVAGIPGEGVTATAAGGGVGVQSGADVALPIGVDSIFTIAILEN